MTVMITREMGQYLQNKGEGTLDVDILVDVQPDTPDNVVSLYDKGGLAPMEDPETWRELYVQVRDTSHQNCYDRIWRVLGYILSPTTAFIEVGTNKYTAQLMEVPSSLGQDTGSRFLFGCRLIVRVVSAGAIGDDWLDALASWTGSVLTGWQVYKVWPGSKRPSIIWRLSRVKASEKSKSAYEVKRKYIGSLLGSTPGELLTGVSALMQGLGGSIKLVLDEPSKQYLKISHPKARIPGEALTAGKVSVLLSRVTNRSSEDTPLMSAVHYKETIS